MTLALGAPFPLWFFSPLTTRATFTKRKSCTYLATRANSIAFYHSGKLDETADGKRVRGRSLARRRAMPLALRVHRERAIVDQSTDLWAADLHGSRAQRKDNRGPRMLARTRTRRASSRPGGGRPSSPPERPCPRVAMRGGLFPSV